jgi:hypothetical protein
MKKEGTLLLKSFYEASIVLIPKMGNTEQKKRIIGQSFNQLRCKNFQQPALLPYAIVHTGQPCSTEEGTSQGCGYQEVRPIADHLGGGSHTWVSL